MSNLKNRQIFIDINTNRLVTAGGGTLMTRPSLIYGSSPYLEFHIVEGINQVDVSDATSWQVSIDVDFDLSTEPMTRAIGTDIDAASATSGVIIAHINTNTQKFQTTVNGKDSVNAQCEIRGFDSTGDTIYCVRFAINCLGAVDLIALSAIPIPDNIASKSYVTAVTSGFQRQIDDLNDEFDEVVDKVEKCEEVVATVSGMGTQISTLSAVANEHTLAIASLNNDIDYISAAVSGMQPTGIDQLRTDINTVSGNLSTLNTSTTTHIGNTNIHVTASEKSLWNAKSDFSGSYNDLTNKPDLTIYETKANVAAVSSSLNDKINEVSGKIPTTTGGVPITYVTASHSYTDEDACKFFYIDEDESISFNAQGTAVSNIYDSTLSGGQLYAAISAETVTPGQVTKVSDLVDHPQPANELEISGTFAGTTRHFVYFKTYTNSFFNKSLPIWKDKTSNTYLYGAKHWDDTPEWCVTTYLPSDGASPVDNGLYYSSTSFGVGTLLHPLQKDFNNSKWEYEDGPYGLTVAANVIGTYPANDVVTDVVNASISGSYTKSNAEFSVGSATITYEDVMMGETVTLDHYTASYTDADNGNVITIGMAYSNGSAGNMPQTYIKVQITSNSETTTYGRFGSIPLSGTTWPSVLSGEYRVLSKINEWETPSEYYTGPKVTLYNVSGDRKGYITTSTPGETSTKIHFNRIPMIVPNRLVTG